MASNLEFPDFLPVEGGCPCKTIRYRVLAPPFYVHCCHCRWCQRETGASFALNAFLERENVEHITSTDPEIIAIPTESGKPQEMARCPKCGVCVWSYYGGSHLTRFLRVGTLDNPDQFPPDIHIFTSSKQPWINLEGCGKPVVAEYYARKDYWPKESLERRERMIAKMKPEEAKTQREWDGGVREGKGESEGADKAIEELTKGTEDVKL